MDKALSSNHAVCVWIPLFALRAEERRRPELIGTPVAVLSAEDTRRLWQVSSRARRSGVEPGMTVSQAIGLCSSLALLEANPVHYDDLFSRLLAMLGDVSPVIEPLDMGRIYVGVDGLERLVGSRKRVLRMIDGALSKAWNSERQQEAVGGSRRRWGRRDSRAVWRLGWARGKFPAWVAATNAKPGNFEICARSRSS